MADSFHGIKIVEASDGIRAIATAATAIIGLIVTAPDADATAYPLDTPTLITDVDSAIGLVGATGTAQTALRAISSQARPIIVMVRVDEGDDTAEMTANVIGTTTATGLKTGMQALLAAQGRGLPKPRIIAAPGLDNQAVTTALVVIAQKLRGMAYCAAIGATVADAVTYAGQFSARELMLLWPNAYAVNEEGETVEVPAAAFAVGLRAQIDRDQGFYKTLSNVELQGVLGLTKDVQWDFENSATEAKLLNDAGITALVRTDDGYRFWGNRTQSSDPKFIFESTVRTAQVLLDTIGTGMLWAVDKVMQPSLAKDVIETIRAKGNELKGGALLGFDCWYDQQKNSTETLSDGKLWVKYQYTVAPPLEGLGATQTITDEYFADFAVGIAA